MTHDPADEIDLLIEAHLSGALDAQGAERLERLIANDPAIADRLAMAASDDEVLRRIFRNSMAAAPIEDRPAHRSFFGWLPAATAAAVLLAFALAVRPIGRFSAPSTDPTSDMRRQAPPNAETGNAVGNADRLVVVDGAQLSFSPDAVYARIDAPDSDGRNLFKLLLGRVDVEVPEGAKRLAIETPNGTLRDTGTKFSVNVSDPRKDQPSMKSSSAFLVFAVVLSGLVDFSPEANPSGPAIRLSADAGRVRLDPDGALGRVDDSEGLAFLRRRGSERWESADAGRPFESGWLAKTALRGANALVLRLANNVKLTLGPGAQIELVGPDQVRLVSGDLALAIPDGVKMTVVTAKGQRACEPGKHYLRETAGAAEALEIEPQWHAAFVGDRSTERMGSLVALVDGRNTPLVMGHHKVSVEIRDQLARTTIDESFINTTTTRLEGTFYFPLPGDASISGFAMWIGDEKVEGEIVEKERAREIYETILRERRDPGLLEWTGGNIFKARVFPIDTEKRIQIRYTQVLPKTDRTVTYRYPLRSDMLRTTPLKKLELEVLVSSAAPIESVACRSHACRIDSTEHSAKAEFSAEEYVPTEDFEFSISLAAEKRAIRVLPHVRGDEGYFLAMFDAPSGAQEAPKKPLDLVILFDTSGSMNGPARATALKFLEGLVESLGTNDILRLAVFDTETTFILDQRKPIEEAERRSAVDVVRSRRPLGWTDLERAIGEALARSGPDTDIIVIGDGVLSKGDRDVAAFLDRTTRAAAGRGRIHTVATGSSSDLVCLSNLALLGGSMREMRSEADAPGAARGLLDELATPGVRDLEFGVEGVATAAVYPSRLGNLPAGKQTFVVGRFDPRTVRPGGRVIVRGRYLDHAVSFATDFPAIPADLGNSFIPRLWAKARLDDLLRQTASADRKQQIIALSEDFQIATPYTSFLVLESDADRERFKVKKSIRMRDGEDFFAEGTRDAQFEQKKKELATARLWRTELRRAILSRYSDLGTSAAELLEAPQPFGENDYGATFGQEAVSYADHSRWARQAGGFEPTGRGRRAETIIDNGGRPGFVGGSVGERELSENEFDGEIESLSSAGSSGPADAVDVPAPSQEDNRNDSYATDPAENLLRSVTDKLSASADDLDESLRKRNVFSYQPARRLSLDASYSRAKLRSAGGFSKTIPTTRGLGYPPDFRPWPRIVQLLPQVPRTYPIDDDILSRGWTPDAVARVRIVDRSRVPWPSDRAVVIGIATREDGVGREYFIHKNGMRMRSTAGPTIGAYETWAEGDQAGAFDRSWMIASVRKAEASDRVAWGRLSDIDLAGALAALPNTGSTAFDSAPDGTVTVRMIDDFGRPTQSWRIDPTRKIVLEMTLFANGIPTQTMTQSDWVEAAGHLWATVLVTKNADGKVIAEVRRTVREMTAAEYEAEAQETTRDLERALLIGNETPTRRAAERAVAENRATIDDRWLLLTEELRNRRMTEAKPHADALLAAIADRPCRDLVSAVLHLDFSRNEDARQAALSIVKGLLDDGSVEAAARYVGVRSLTGPMTSVERLEIFRLVWPLLDRHVGKAQRLANRFEMAAAIQNAGDLDAAIDFARKTVESYPESAAAHGDLGRLLRQKNRGRESYDYLRSALATHREKLGESGADLRKTLVRWTAEDALFDDEIAEIDLCVAEYPKSVTAEILIDRHLARIRTGRVAESDREIAAALERIPETEEPSLDRARFLAALWVESGLASGFSRRSISGAAAERLAELFTILEARSPRDSSSDVIFNGAAFSRTPEYRRLLESIRNDFLSGPETLPIEKLARAAALINSRSGDDPRWIPEVIARKVLARWTPFRRPATDEAVQVLVDRFATVEQKIEHLKMLVAAARTPGERLGFDVGMFEVLSSAPWSAEREDALFALLPRVAEADRRTKMTGDRHRLPERVRRLTATLIEERTTAAVAAIPDVNQKSKRVLAVLQSEKRKESRAALMARLAELEKSFEPASDRRFFALERRLQEIRRGQNDAATRAALKELLAPVVLRVADSDVDDIPLEDIVFLMRGSAAMAQMTVRAADQADATTAYFEFLELLRSAKSRLFDPDAEKIDMLLALDRRAEAVAAVTAAAEKTTGIDRARHERMIARMRAEDGDFAGAISAIESAMKNSTPTADDYEAIVRWQTVLGPKDAARLSRIKSFEAMDIDRLAIVIYQTWQRLRDNGDGAPGNLDEDTADMLTVLLRRSQNPSWHLEIVQGLYAATKDFRIPRAFAEAMVGGTEGSVYGLLGSMGQIFTMLQDEAAIDQIFAEIARQKAANPSPTDRRALDLLHFSVRHRMLEQKEGGRAHLADVLAALEEAFQGTFSAETAVNYANFLASKGKFAAPEVSDLAIKQLIELERSVDAASNRKVSMMQSRAYVEWQNDRREDAIRTMTAVVDSMRDLKTGKLPMSAIDACSRLIEYRESTRDWREAERFWTTEIARGYSEPETFEFEQHLIGTATRALANGATIALGRGPELYRELFRRLHAPLVDGPRRERDGRLLAAVIELWNSVRSGECRPFAEADLKTFAFVDTPRILANRRGRDDIALVWQVASRLIELVDPALGVKFLVERAEAMPPYLEMIGEGFWSSWAWQLSQGMSKAGFSNLSEDIAERAWRIVERELRRDLEQIAPYNRTIYSKDDHYWSQKEKRFVEIATEIALSPRSDEAIVMHCAEYVAHSLRLASPAADIVLDRLRRGSLTTTSRSKLVGYLENCGRHAAALPIARDLVREEPKEANHRYALIRVLAALKQMPEAEAELDRFEKEFLAERAGKENMIASMADLAMTAGFPKTAARLFEEALNLNIRSSPSRGVGNAQTASYYRKIAEIRRRLGETDPAIAAAMAEIVVWPEGHNQRTGAIENLNTIVSGIDDLRGYVAEFEKEVAATKLENPILRRALGVAFDRKSRPAEAAEQYRKALETAPEDLGTAELLVRALGAAGQKQAARDAAWEYAETKGRDPELFIDVGRRSVELGEKDLAERAFTNAIEISPNESENHRAVAELREQSEKFDEAVFHWGEVAKLRSLEPTGLLNRARVLIRLGRAEEAKKDIEQLRTQKWDPRFAEELKKIAELERSLSR